MANIIDLQDSILGSIYWKDLNFVYRGCNEYAAKMAGLIDEASLIGKTDYDIFEKEIADGFRENDIEVIKSGKSRVVEEKVIMPDGRVLIQLSSKKPLRDGNGKICGVIGNTVDITYLKKIEGELIVSKELAEAASKLKTEFVQNMQHDIRTPASGLWGVLDALARAEVDSDKKEALDMAVAASKRLLDLCNDAVEFGDLSGHSRPQLAKPFDLRNVAKSVIELNLPAAFAKDLLFHFSIDSTVPVHVISDEFRINRILINLLGNAIKFTHKGEVSLKIKAKLDKDDNRHGVLFIEIKDTGIGIAPDKINNIYEKFTRGVPSNTNKYPGTGLGLYVVKTFVDELEGDIEVESHENEGTYFKLSIPFKVLWEDIKKPGVEIDEHLKSPLKRESEQKRHLEPKKERGVLGNTPFAHEVLIIEDDKICLFAEKNLLSGFTNKIDTAENVTEALEKLSKKRYDLVISDIGLPDGSGNDIVSKVKANIESPNYKTPFVAMTAHQDALKHQQAKEAGFIDTNTKPLGTDKAVELLKTYPAQESITEPKEEGLSVIDIALGMQRMSALTEEPAIESLDVLWNTLQADMPRLRLAEENNDIDGANALLLKIRGGLYYTGTPRLEKACEVLFEEVKRVSEELREIHNLFSMFYDEAKLFIEHFNELRKGIKAQKEAERFRLESEQNKALLEQEAKFTQIANKVAHDIRSPLSALITIVNSCTQIPEERRIALREAAVNMSDIANHLLYHYKKKGTDEVVEQEEHQTVLVSTILQEVLTTKKYQYDKLPIKFDCIVEPHTYFASIKIQVSHFKRMLSNLINNAVDACEGEEGRVHLQLEADNEWVKIRIQDTGKGMPAELVDKIRRKTAVTQSKALGHGLGLTQVWETLDDNLGELSIESKPNQGTTMTVTFPRITAPQWVAEEIVLNANDIVVILDDDSSIHNAWQIRFEALLNENPQLQLKHFQSGSDALKFIDNLASAEKEWVFLLSDYELLQQNCTGLEIIAKSKAPRSILVTSHYADSTVQEEALRTGTPILPKQLVSEVIIKMSGPRGGKTDNIYAVIVDDNRNFVNSLQRYGFGDKITEAYYHPEKFLENIAKYPKDTRIFMDNTYDCSSLSGLDLAEKLHELGYTRLFILSGESFLKAPSYVTVIVKGSPDFENLLDL